MTEKESPIIDFYPLNFGIDLNGKRYEWQGVALLPFVDEKRLHRTLEHVYDTLTPEEQKRNKRDYDRLYVHSTSLCCDYFKELYNKGGDEVTRKNPMDMPTMLSGGMSGRIWRDDEEKLVPIGTGITAPLTNLESVENNQVLCVKFRDLAFDNDYIFKSKLLENVTIPPTTLRPRDHDQGTPYRPNTGFAQTQQYQRDFAPAQRFIRHSMGSQYNQQPDRQQGQYNSYNYNRPQQSYSSQSNYRQPYHQNDHSGPRQNYRPRMPHHQQRPNNNNYNNNYNNNNYRQNMNGGGGGGGGGGSWS